MRCLCVCCSSLRHWLAVEYVWVLVPYMTYDIYVMYLCHWHKSRDRGIAEKKHSLASVWSFLLQERLMVTHHLFILIVLTPITQVRAGHGCCEAHPREEPRDQGFAIEAASGKSIFAGRGARDPLEMLGVSSRPPLREGPMLTAGFICSTSGESWGTSSWAASS